jgi:hypothetical protein
MADEVVKRISIPKKEVVSVSPNGDYYVRYRVVSEGGARASHWSQVFVLNGDTLSSPLNSVSLSYYGGSQTLATYTAISVNWTVLDTLNINNYDVYVRYGTTNADYFNYYTSTTANSVLIPKGTTGVSLTVAILAKGTSTLDYGILRSVTYRASLSGSTTSFLAESSSFSV